MSEERLIDYVNRMICHGWYYSCGWMYHDDPVKPRDVRKAIAEICAPKNYWESEQIMQTLRKENDYD